MSINQKAFEKYTFNNFYTMYNSFFKKIEKDYSVIGIDNEVLMSIYEESFFKMQDDIDSYQISNIEKHFHKILRININSYVCEIFNDIDRFKNVILSLLNNDNLDFDKALKNIKNVSALLKLINYYPEFDYLIELLNYNEFKENIKLIVEKYYDLIINNKMEKVFKEDFIISIIEAFCIQNNIEIKEEFKDLNNSSMNDEFSNISTTTAYLNELESSLLTEREEKELFTRIINGDEEARNIFIKHNLRLSVNIAKRYVGKGLDFLDLIQEGNLGLMNAVNKFDIDLGYRFSTYATWWIRQAITRAIADKGRCIRIPVHLYERVMKFTSTKKKLDQKFGRESTIAEIAKEMRITEASAYNLYLSSLNLSSLNVKISDEDETELGDFIEDSKTTPEDETLKLLFKENVMDLLKNSNLKSNEKEILIMRFGIDGEKPKTLEEIGYVFNVTRERIRQIEAKALKKLRRSKMISNYAIYMDNPDEALRNIEEMKNEDKKKDDTTYLKSQKYREKLKEKKMVEEIQILPEEKVKENVEMKVKQIQTLYELINNYMKRKYNVTFSKEDIDSALNILSNEEKEIIALKYGESYDKLADNELEKKDKNKMFNTIVPKIKAELINTHSINVLNKVRSLYDNLNNYNEIKNGYTFTKEEIDSIIKDLKSEELELLKLRYGETLEEENENVKLDKETRYKIDNLIIPKIKRRLSFLHDNGRAHAENRLTLYEYANNHEPRNYDYQFSKEEVDEVIEKFNEDEKRLLKIKFGDDYMSPEKRVSWILKDRNKFYQHILPKLKRKLLKYYNDNVLKNTPEIITNKKNIKNEKEDNQVLELIDHSSLNAIISESTPLELIIIWLSFGYINNKYYTPEVIAEFLGIELNTVIEIIEKTLLEYKEFINKYIDDSIKLSKNNFSRTKK